MISRKKCNVKIYRFHEKKISVKYSYNWKKYFDQFHEKKFHLKPTWNFSESICAFCIQHWDYCALQLKQWPLLSKKKPRILVRSHFVHHDRHTVHDYLFKSSRRISLCYLLDKHMIYEAAKRNFAYMRTHSGLKMEK